jgi:hypothetical protein
VVEAREELAVADIHIRPGEAVMACTRPECSHLELVAAARSVELAVKADLLEHMVMPFVLEQEDWRGHTVKPSVALESAAVLEERLRNSEPRACFAE